MTSFRHGFKSKIDNLTAEPKSLLLIPKCHFRTINEWTLGCFIERLLYYCKSSVLCRVLRERKWASVINWIRYSVHSSDQFHIHKKALVWMSAKESNIFVVLYFHLLMVIFWWPRCSGNLLSASYMLLLKVNIASLFTTAYQSLSIQKSTEKNSLLLPSNGRTMSLKSQSKTHCFPILNTIIYIMKYYLLHNNV